MLLLAVCAAVFLALAFALIAVTMEIQSRQMSERFTTLVREAEPDIPEDLKASLRERVLAPALEALNEFAMRLTPRASLRVLTRQLERAGRPWGLSPATWTLLRMVSAVCSVVLALILVPRLPLTPSMRLGAICLVAAAGVLGPGFLLDRAISLRQMEIRRTLPDIIDLLVVSVEAGLGLDAAVQEVVQRRRGPLVDELARVLGEVLVGKPRRAAWQDMAVRVDLLELKGLVAALMQGEELGASISGVLRGQSDAIRERRSIRVREVAAVLPVKMLFPLVFFIFPGMFVVILGPGMINLLASFRSIGF